jgi:hypothetical protein
VCANGAGCKAEPANADPRSFHRLFALAHEAHDDEDPRARQTFAAQTAQTEQLLSPVLRQTPTQQRTLFELLRARAIVTSSSMADNYDE